MTVSYPTLIKDIKDKLLSVIKSTTTFANKATADYINLQDESRNPIATLRLRSDTFRALASKETSHTINFEIWIHYVGGYQESTLDALVEYVGEIIDAIEADRTLGSSYVINTEVKTVDFSMTPLASGRSPVRHTARILVEVLAIRNL